MTTRRSLTPPIGAKGFYEVLAPYSVVSGMIYTCDAIRSFPDFVKLGVDVYNTFYNVAPFNLANGQPYDTNNDIFQFQDEVNLNANIITLMGTDNRPLYIPDTFILSYPNMPNRPYSFTVLSASLGPIPDDIPLDNLMLSIANLIRQQIGVTATVNLNRAPASNNPSNEQSISLESARTAAIGLVETDLSKRLAVEAQNTLLQGHVTQLTSLLQSHGLLPSL